MGTIPHFLPHTIALPQPSFTLILRDLPSWRVTWASVVRLIVCFFRPHSDLLPTFSVHIRCGWCAEMARMGQNVSITADFPVPADSLKILSGLGLVGVMGRFRRIAVVVRQKLVCGLWWWFSVLFWAETPHNLFTKRLVLHDLHRDSLQIPS